MTFSKQIGAEHGMARDVDSDDNETPYNNEVSNGPYCIGYRT